MPMWRAVNLSGTKDRGSGKPASIDVPFLICYIFHSILGNKIGG
jgi:hypothetical protein